jgi:signal transduction histidine kinase
MPALRLRRPLPDVLPLVGLLACPALPPPWAAVGVAAFAALYLVRRRPRREALLVAVAGGGALLALGADWLRQLSAGPSRAEWLVAATSSYRALWQDLEGEAAAAAREIGTPPRDAAARLATFAALAHQAGEGGSARRRTLLVVDPDGEPVAWGGEGLLREFAPQDLPAAGGTSALAGFEGVTLLAVRPLTSGRRPWRVVAGYSLPTDRLPFDPPGFKPAESYRWSVEPGVPDDAGVAPRGVRLEAPPAPAIRVEDRAPFAWRSRPPWRRLGPRVAWALLAFALVTLAVLRTIGLAILAATVLRRAGETGQVAVLAAGAALCGALALAVAAWIAGALALGVGLAALGLLGERRPSAARGGEALHALAGALVAATLLLACGAVQLWRGPLDLASGMGGGWDVHGLRLALAASATGLLALAAGRSSPRGRGDLAAWIAVLLLVGAAAAHDRPLLGAALLAAGAAVGTVWARAAGLPRPAPAAVLALLGALAAATSWEAAHRWALRRELVETLPALRPPEPAETASAAAALDTFFADLDAARLAVGEPLPRDRRDLALAIWRASPLAQPNRSSALVVLAENAVESSFAFGLPLTADGDLDRDPGRWQALSLPAWDEALIAGEAPLEASGRTLGRLRYWLLLRPGFRLAAGGPGAPEAGLLRGEPGLRAVQGLPRSLRYALYDSGGRARRSPWKEAPPLPAALRQSDALRRVAVPGGRAWARARRGADGIEALFLPALGPLRGFDRVGTHAAGALALVAAGVVLGVLLGLPRAAFRDLLRRAVRSYSKRLILVFTALLLVPLLLLGFVLVRGLQERLRRDQQAAGEAALDAAQRVLGEYLLTLEPGFGIETALEDDLLVWLSRVVQHEVNLYWGSRLYASSKRELFTAGLLPARIPGEIYTRMALLGYDMTSRTNRAGDTAYLELYTPLQVPGVPAEREGLTLSMPLLAQQEETAAEIAALRRQVLLGTVALFVLLVAVGTRLARNFTAPLMELVRGTQRIAGGAASVGFRPSELELVALVEAVDRMAQRIAEARDRLLREKQVVDSMVDNIAAGVVSLDHDRRVLMRNRVAADLLGVEVGERIGDAVGRRPQLGALAQLLRRAGGEPAQETLRVGGEREWSVVWVPVPGAGEPAALLVVEDVTEVLRAQRLQAWAEMARMIAHEIKNPLTPIRLSAEHMREVWEHDRERFAAVFERCTANILRQVEDLRQIAAEFSTYSRIPRIELVPGDLAAAVGEVVEGYRAAPPAGVRVDFSADPPRLPARFDAKLLGRALRNLLENALRASRDGGGVCVRVERHGAEARIVVADAGPGVPEELLGRIFDPYFSTHDTGTGLGLPIASRIAQEHGGQVTARNRPGGGLEVTITIPLP